MDLAYAAGRAGGTMTGVLSAANEKAVELFIDEKYDTHHHPFSSFHCIVDSIVWFCLRTYSLQF